MNNDVLKYPGQGVLGGSPLGEGGVPKSQAIEGRGKAFPPMISASMLALSLLLSAIALSDVVCTWDGTGYTCSGSGTVVQIGGGGASGGGGDGVVTNGFGVCTNCSQITPAELRALATEVDQGALDIRNDAFMIEQECEELRNAISSNNNDIATYRTFDTGTPMGRIWGTVSNYMVTAGNGQSQAMQTTFSSSTAAFTTKQYQTLGAANGIYYYANNVVKPQNDANLAKIASIEREAENIGSAASTLQDPVAQNLLAGAVECEGYFQLDGGGGGGSTNSAPSTGDWCTYDQGEALKALLEELKDYARKQHAQLSAISNYTRQASELLRSGLFTDYNAIPSAAGLGDWRQVYLDGAETNWGYQPTNILARIELLLYGMSGVGTNETDFTEESAAGSTEVMDDLEEHKDEAADQIRALDTDADGTGAQTLGSALIAFFQAFTPQTSAHQGGEEAIPSYSYTLNGEEYYVDAIATPSNVTTLNTLRSASGTVCGAIYLVVSGWAVFAYWRWFAEKAVQLSRWAVELVTSMFGS